MPVTYSLLSPSPPWASITSSGLLSIGVVPDEGYIGLIRVRAIDGVLSATKDIPLNIQAKYRVVLDFVEVSDYILNAAIGGAFYESFEVQSALDYVLNPAIGGAFYEDTNYLLPTIVPLDIVIDMPIARVLPSPIIPMSIVVDMPIVGVPTSKSLPMDIIVGMPIVGAPTTASIPMDIVVGTPIVTATPSATIPLNIVMDMPISSSRAEVVPSYTIAAQTQSTYQVGSMPAPGVYFALTYNSLNDGDFNTGVGVTNHLAPSGSTSSMTFDLGTVTSLSHVQLSGGFLAFPFNDNTAAYINGTTLQRSNDGTTWTNIVVLSGITDSTYTSFTINQSARYIRLTGTVFVFTSFILHRFT